MANAEQLLNEAQYAFQSVSVGQSRDNERNASRARSICKKIIRRFPTTTEAAEAHAILRRLGDEAYSSKMSVVHRHIPQAEHHTPATPRSQVNLTHSDETVLVDWAGLLAVIFRMPRVALGVIAFFGFILFGIFGPFLFVPLIAFLLLTGPVRNVLKPQQRRDLNTLVTRANAYLEEQRKSLT